MILMSDSRIPVEEIREKGSLYMCLLFLLNAEKGLQLNPAKIGIYYGQLKANGAIAVDGTVSIEEFFEFFKVEASIKDESLSYKLKRAEKSIINYNEDSSDKPQYVVGVGNVVCYNPNGKILKGKPVEAIIVKIK